MKRLRGLRRAHRRKVSLIGWNLGGIYAHELAKVAAKDVRLVIGVSGVSRSRKTPSSPLSGTIARCAFTAILCVPAARLATALLT